jgi:sugar phosphate isomerase/epimerase
MNELGLLVALNDKCGIIPPLARVKSFGFTTCQISIHTPDLLTEAAADSIHGFCVKNDLRVSMLWAGWPGKHDWSFTGGPETIGLVPPQFRMERSKILKKASDFAKFLRLDRIATHAGFIPENMHDPVYMGLIPVLRELADYCGRNGQFFCFETGQETPVTLLRVIEDIGTENLGVNFDPANLVMYGKANALDALSILGSYVKGVHIKDGKYPVNGRELGIEVSIGEGDVNIPLFLHKLRDLGYTGPLTIEVEPDRRIGQISAEEAIRGMAQYLRSYIRQDGL